MIFILFLFTSLPTLQKWSGKDPGNYKSIKGRLIIIMIIIIIIIIIIMIIDIAPYLNTK